MLPGIPHVINPTIFTTPKKNFHETAQQHDPKKKLPKNKHPFFVWQHTSANCCTAEAESFRLPFRENPKIPVAARHTTDDAMIVVDSNDRPTDQLNSKKKRFLSALFLPDKETTKTQITAPATTTSEQRTKVTLLATRRIISHPPTTSVRSWVRVVGGSWRDETARSQRSELNELKLFSAVFHAIENAAIHGSHIGGIVVVCGVDSAGRSSNWCGFYLPGGLEGR